MLKLIKLTEEEIAKLPFPETARKIGGIMDFVDIPVSEETMKIIRKQFRESMHNADVFRAPIEEGDDA